MKTELNDNQLDEIVGGTVIISKNTMKIGFSTTGERFKLQNCTYRDARNLMDDLLEANPNMSNAAFDKYCKQQFKNKGWI